MDIEPLCQICGEELTANVVNCRRCNTPHHQECWVFYGACSTYGCLEKQYTGPEPVGRQPSGSEQAKQGVPERERDRENGGRRGKKLTRSARRRARARKQEQRERQRRSDTNEAPGRRTNDQQQRQRRMGFSSGCGCLLVGLAIFFGIPFLYNRLPHVRARRAAHQEMKQELVALGGSIDYGNGDDLDGVIRLRDTKTTDEVLTGLKYFSGSTATLDLNGTLITDRGMKWVADLEHLSELDVGGTRITNRGLEAIAQTRLRSLILDHTKVNDRGLPQLRNMDYMRHLDLSHTDVSDAGLVRLGHMSRLQTLKLRGTKVKGTGLRHLSRDARFKLLDLSETPFDDEGIEFLLQDWGFRQLLPDCRIILEKSQVSEEGLRKLHSKYRLLRIEPRPRFVPENPINLSSAAEANIEGGAAEGVGHAIDGDLATRWTVQKWDTPRDHGARRRAYLELEWETKVGIQKIVVREAGDCLTHLRVLAFNRQTEKWNEVASLQAQGRKTFVMGSINPRDPRWVRIDGQRPDELGERELGSGDRKVHPVFEFILPNERTTQRLRFEILKASTDPVEISEIEIYGREIK